MPYSNEQLNAMAKAKIDAARAGLLAAMRQDRDAGLTATAEQRNVRPVRPAILDQVEDFSWPTEIKRKFQEERAKQEQNWLEHILVADPSLLDDSARKALPKAIRICNAQITAAETATRGKV